MTSADQPPRPKLAELWLYPLKGARGVSVRDWTIDAFGLHLDRRWMLAAPDGSPIYQRTHAKMALIDLAIDADYLRLEAPGMTALRLPLAGPGADAAITVNAFGSRVSAHVVPGDASAWFAAFLGTPCALVHMPDDGERFVDPDVAPGHRTSFTNGYPIHLVSQEALDHLNTKLESPVGMSRFRANFVVSGVIPHQEDRWRRIKIGDLQFEIVKPCDHRCGVPNVDPATGQWETEPLRTLATYRRHAKHVSFGQNLVPVGGGRIERDQPIEILATGPPRPPLGSEF
ncbi:MAG: MOSC N-terminal beta barrel domain-containing protein [Planctomycetota bacterium]